jgi:hypothetical protein
VLSGRTEELEEPTRCIRIALLVDAVEELRSQVDSAASFKEVPPELPCAPYVEALLADSRAALVLIDLRSLLRYSPGLEL